MNFLGIKVKLFILMSILLIPILLFEIASIYHEFENNVESKLMSNMDLAQAISNSFSNYIEELWIQDEIISTYIVNNPDLSPKEISSYLKEVAKKQETIQAFTWVDLDGVCVASSMDDMIGVSIKHRDYFQRILKGEDKVLSNLIVSVIKENPILPVTKAIKKDGQLKGVMLAVINVEKIGLRFSDLHFYEGDVFTLIDANGTILYRSNEPDVYLKNQKILDDALGWRALKGEMVKTRKISANFDGSVRMGSAYPLRDIGWALALTSKHDIVLKDINKKAKVTLFLFILVLLISFGTAFLIGKYIMHPIEKLKDAASKISLGDYSIRTNISGYDEIAVTAQAFDRMAESIEKNDKMKSQFFTNLSHELKTPLNVIFASIQLISKVHGTSVVCSSYPKIHKQLLIMKQNSYRLIRMVSNLIDISKYDYGFLKIRLGNYDIVSIVENITQSIVRFADTKEIKVLFDTETEEKIMACDPDMIERIMLNLISNALKFTERGGGIFVNIFDKENHIIISVKDTGIGIPPHKLNTIFDRFEQVDSSLSRNHEGSGIGLSIVKALVEGHNGKITANSILGEGTEFIIELPVYLVQEDEHLKRNFMEDINSRLVEKISIEFSDIYNLPDIS